MAVITTIGAGMMGSGIAFPACTNGHTVRLVGTPLDDKIIKYGKETGYHLTLKHDVNGTQTSFKMPEGVSFHCYDEFSEMLKGADILLCGVSSFGLSWFCENIVPLIPEDLPVLSVTKGMIDDGTGTGHLISYPEYMQCFSKKKLNINAVGGPCTSYELADHDPTEVAFCGKDPETLKWLKSIYETDYYHISLSTDVRGVECAVALKNAYALAVSLAVGLSHKREERDFQHYNSQAALFGQASKEMEKLLMLFGGRHESLWFGIGDLYVTVFGGRTRKIGTLLGEGLNYDEAMEKLKGVTLESIVITGRTADAVVRLSESGLADISEFPLLMHIRSLLSENAKVDIPWSDFETDYFQA